MYFVPGSPHLRDRHREQVFRPIRDASETLIRGDFYRERGSPSHSIYIDSRSA